MLSKIFSRKWTNTLVLVSIFFIGDSFAQGNQFFVETEASIQEVTLFRKSAAIKRSLSMKVYRGTTQFRFTNIPKNLTHESLKVLTNNDKIKVLSYDVNGVRSEALGERIAVLKDSINWVSFDLRKVNAELEVEIEGKMLLTLNKKRIGTSDGLDAIDLDEAIEYYVDKLSEINGNIIKLEQKKQLLEEKIVALNERNKHLEESRYVAIDVIVYSELSTDLKLDLNYFVEGSYWSPYYHVSLEEINDNVMPVSFHSEIVNNTGNDWSNVDLKLVDRHLGFIHQDSLADVFSSDYLFDISFPYDLIGDGRSYHQEVDRMNFNVKFNYSIDVASEEVNFVAKSFDWGNFDLISAPLKVFKNDLLSHLSFIDVPKGKGEISFVLGKDNRILFHKEGLEEENQGSSSKEAEFVLTNTRGERIAIEMFETISSEAKIKSKSLESSGGKYDSENGVINWGFSIKPNSKKVIKYYYQ